MVTAEQAAAENLRWRAVNAPETITSSERSQAAQYLSNYQNVERPAQQARDAAIQQTIYQNRQMINRQEGLSYAGTHTQAQLAALSGSAAVGRQAYEQERSYYESAPSAEFLRIQGEYSARRNAIVSSSGISYPATGWMTLNTTAGEGEYTGRAAEYKAAYEREVYGIGAPDSEQEYYRRATERAVVERAGYTAPAELGDIRTQQIRQGYGMFSQAVGLAGGEVASDYQITGRIIETQRQAAYATPTRRDERFFMGELQKWAEIPVEQASAYHDIGMESGKAIPANPYEYQADLAVEFLKGSPDKASEFFSPVSGEMSRHLPSGQGVQEFAWEEAITDYKRQTGAAQTPYPERVSFMEGVTYLGAAEGKYGPYGKLAGGIDNGGVDLGAGRTRVGNIVGGVSSVGIGEMPKPFVSVSQPKAEPNEYKPSGFLGLGGLLPEMPSYERTKAYAVNLGSQIREAGPVAGLGIVAKEEFGAPISTAAGVASRLSFGASEIIFKPEPVTVGKGQNQKTYASEWDAFVEGSGRVTREVTGLTLEKQEAYFTTIKSDSSTIGEAKRGVFYIGTTIVNKPAELAPAVILGWATAGAGAAAPSFLAKVGAGTGITAKGATFLMTPGGASLAKAGIVGAFGSAYTYDVTEGLKATPEATKRNIYTSLPALAAMYGGGGGFNWMGETRIVRGVSSPSGATFTGARVYETYLGGGKTPTGQRYAGAFSPTESYVFTGRGAAQPARATVTPQAQLKLPSGSGGYGAETYPSSFEGPVRDYSKMDISGGARPFTMKTSPEMQAASTIKFRDTSGKASPFTIKTQADITRPSTAKPIVSEVIGDFSGKAQSFTMKTAAEVKAGYWDVAEPIPRGDISGRGSKFSLTTEKEYVSGLPRDVSGRGESFAARTQEEISATWEMERTLKEQNIENVRWVGDVVKGKIGPTYEEPYRVATYGEMIEMVKPTKQPATSQQIAEFLKPSQRPLVATEMGEAWVSGFYKKSQVGQPESRMFDEYKREMKSEGNIIYREPELKKRGYAPAPERAPFSIPGASEYAISKELQSMHPAYSEQMKVSTGSKRYPMTLVEREFPYTRIEREAMGRMFSPQRESSISPTPYAGPSITPYYRRKPIGFAMREPMEITEMESKKSVGFSGFKSTTRVPATRAPSITEIGKPYSRSTVAINPFRTTTPVETNITDIVPREQEYPVRRITETPRPTDIIYPTQVKPLTGFPLGGQLPGGGGGTRLYGNLGVRTWRRENLVATAEYLGRGMRDIGFGWGDGTGTYTEKTKWFSTGKKKTKRRKRK